MVNGIGIVYINDTRYLILSLPDPICTSSAQVTKEAMMIQLIQRAPWKMKESYSCRTRNSLKEKRNVTPPKFLWRTGTTRICIQNLRMMPPVTTVTLAVSFAKRSVKNTLSAF